MICLNCRKQIADDTRQCPSCGKEVIGHEQLPKEISFRRYQRWFFYALISLVFIGMVVAIIKIYDTNTQLILNINQAQKQLQDVTAKAQLSETDLAKKSVELAALQSNLQEKSQELQAKTDEFKTVLDSKVEIQTGYEKCQLDLSSADANIYNLIIRLGVGITNRDLIKIPLADSNFGGQDGDGDGLSDAIENSLGTDPSKIDSDGDSFSDKDEIINGFNPLGSGSIKIDAAFASKQKGKIFLQVENDGEAWYINPADAKRYYLGQLADAFQTMRSLEYWAKK